MDKLIIEQEIQNQRQDSFWYDGLVAELGKYRLYAVGDINIVFPNGIQEKDGRAVEYAYDLNFKDNNLKDVEWINNNWFEVGWIDKNNHMQFDVGIVEYNYPSAIEMLKSYYKGEVK